MRSVVRSFLSFLIPLLLCSTAFAQGAKVSGENPAASQRDRPQERANWFMRGRMVDGKPGAAQLHRAYDQKLNNRRLQGLARARAAQGTSAETTASPRPQFVTAPAGSPPWNFLGPAPTATAAFNNLNQQNYGPAIGRVTAVAVDQSDTTGNTVYIGGASGGLWRTTNAVSAARACDGNGVCTANVGWTPLTDGQATLTVGSIALSPANSDCAAASPAHCLILVGSGEANNSADSYYGLGILRSTDAGANWTLISSATCPTQNPACPASGSVSFHGLGFTHVAFSTDNPSRVVATAAAASGGLTVGAETGGSNARGIYFSTDAGVNWTRATVSDGATSPDPGSANAVIYNARQHKFYANLRYHGFYSSGDGASWTRLPNQPAGITLSNCPTTNSGSGCPLYRAEMAVLPPVPDSNGNPRDEMYVWIYDSQENDIGIYQTKDGGLTWTQISTSGIDNCGDIIGGCGTASSGGQGAYNIVLAAVPNGSAATDLYAGGVNEYKCAIDPTLNQTCVTKPFLNLTHVYGCNPVANIAHVHPDEHGVDFLGNDGTGAFFVAHPSFSPPVFFGNDGGIYRLAQSASLTNGTCPASGTTPASPFDNLSSSSGLSMIQFVGFAQDAADAGTLLGGTQDNGSPAVSNPSPASVQWLSVNNGDGGFSAINPLNASEWFTENPAPLVLGGGIQRCAAGIACTNQTFLTVVTQDKIGADNSSFYTFFTLDPQASERMLVASCRVWRGNSDGSGSDWSSGGGNPLSQNFDTGTTGNGATCGGSTPFFVNTIAAGGPCNGTGCNPGITPGSSTGGGSQVVWAGMEGIADANSASVQCPNGLPCGGQVWVTTQADADLSTTPNKWTEVSGLGLAATPNVSAACTSTPSPCNINPKHYTISGIALDPNDATGKTAYVTVMGFGVGHIFKTIDAGATWAKLDGDPNTTGLPDAPADAVAADPSVANLIYVGTDVGVFSFAGDCTAGCTWTELGPASGAGSLPNVTITQLKVYNHPSDPIPLRLRASTYGRAIWEIPISTAAGYTMAISNPDLFAFAGQTASYSGNIAPFNGYASSINVTCASGATAPPSTCPTSGAPVIATSGNFGVVAGNGSAGDFNFNIAAVGSDPRAVTQQAAVTFHAVDFSLGPVPAATVAQGNSADVAFSVSAQGQFTGNVTLSCTGQPSGSSCTFSPAVVSLTPSVPTANVELTIPTTSSTATGPYAVTITGMGAFGTATQPHTAPLAMTVTSATQGFAVTSAVAFSPARLKPGQLATASLNVVSQGSYTGTLALTCAFDTLADSAAGATCAMDKTAVTLTAGQSLLATVTVNSAGAVVGSPRVIVTATDAPNHTSSSLGFGYTVIDYSLALGAAAAAVPGGSTTANVTIAAAGSTGYTGSVTATCAAPSPLTCSLNPAGPFTLTASSSSASATATITALSNAASNTYTVAVNTNDAAFTALTHNQTVSVAVKDFSVTATTITGTVTAGNSAQYTISVAPGAAGANGPVTLSCTSGVPSLAACQFGANATLDPTNGQVSTTLTITTTAPSVSQLRLPASRRTVPLYALWLTLPGIVVGIIEVGIAPRNRRGKLLGYAGLVVVLGMSLVLASCGGGGGGTTTTPPIPRPGTPAGTYQITVTGASGSGATSLSHNAVITLTVQ